MADAGSLFGGSASGALIKKGWSINGYTLVPNVFPKKATASGNHWNKRNNYPG